MLKTFVATGFSCLAIGSITGYLISEATRNTANQAIAQTVPAISKPTRKELEDRYIKTLSGYRLTIDTKELKVFTDRQLNDEAYRLESLLRAGKAYTPPD